MFVINKYNRFVVFISSRLYIVCHGRGALKTNLWPHFDTDIM